MVGLRCTVHSVPQVQERRDISGFLVLADGQAQPLDDLRPTRR